MLKTIITNSECTECQHVLESHLQARAVTKRPGPRIFPGYYECEPRLLSQKTEGKGPKALPCCTIPLLLIAYTRQLEMLSNSPVPVLES